MDSNPLYSGSIKTTIDIPDRELRDAIRYTRAKTKREAVVKALEDFNRRQRMAALVKHFGTFDSLATNDEIEALELERARTLFSRKESK